jgi:hypothetical protein
MRNEEMTTIFPLNLVRIGNGASLLVVTCAYSLQEGTSIPDFRIAADTIAFHLFAAAS